MYDILTLAACLLVAPPSTAALAGREGRDGQKPRDRLGAPASVSSAFGRRGRRGGRGGHRGPSRPGFAGPRRTSGDDWSEAWRAAAGSPAAAGTPTRSSWAKGRGRGC